MLYNRHKLKSVRVDARSSSLNIVFLSDLSLRNYPVAVFCDHRKRPTSEIAEAAGKVGVGPFNKIFVAKLAVLPEYHLPQQEITDGIDLEMFM